MFGPRKNRYVVEKRRNPSLAMLVLGAAALSALPYLAQNKNAPTNLSTPDKSKQGEVINKKEKKSLPPSPETLESLVKETAREKGINDKFIDLYFKVPHKDFIADTQKYFPEVSLPLIAGLMFKESSFNPNAVSSSNAKGLTQLKDWAYLQLYNVLYSSDPHFKKIRKSNPKINSALSEIIDREESLENLYEKARVASTNTRLYKRYTLMAKNKEKKAEYREKYKGNLRDIRYLNRKIHGFASKEVDRISKNEQDSILVGRAYLATLINDFGNDVKKALAAYNAGETLVKKELRGKSTLGEKKDLRTSRKFYVAPILLSASRFSKIDNIVRDLCQRHSIDIGDFYRATYKRSMFKNAPKYHVVKKGETPYGIAKLYGGQFTHHKLLAVNGIENPTKIPSGKKLKLPL